MRYTVEISPRALKDLRKIEHQSAVRIIKKIRIMENDLSGDVKRLTDFDVGYRLRVGDFRVLFDVRSDVLVIRRIKHRSEAY